MTLRSIFLLLCLGFWFLKANAQCPPSKSLQRDTIILKITEAVLDAFNENISDKKIVEKNIHIATGEDGFGVMVYNNGGFQKLTFTSYAEMGKVTSEYFMWDSVLAIAITKTYSYNEPMGLKNSKIISVDEEKYYFRRDETLLKWVCNKETISPQNSEYTAAERRVVKSVKALSEKFGFCKLTAKKMAIMNIVRCKYGTDCPSTGYVLKGSRNSCGAVQHVKPQNTKVPLEL